MTTFKEENDLKVSDIKQGDSISSRASVLQKKTGFPVQFEIAEHTRTSISAWIDSAKLIHDNYLFPSRNTCFAHLSTRQYARITKSWFAKIDLDPNVYGTHSLRCTKATLIYRNSKNLRAVQLLLGHTKLESTVRYLGIEVSDALELAEQTEV